MVIIWPAAQKVLILYAYLKCGGLMKYQSAIKQVVCQSCGLSLTRQELDGYWKKVRNENISEVDESQRKKNRRKEWLDWYSSSKDSKEKDY
ncbi:MAG: hypothetical protein ACFFCI_08460 [Promethearchaeota archaeon]